MKILPAALLSALVFAAVHADPGQFVQLMFAGVLFATVFEKSRSLVPSIVAHSLMNCTSVAIVLLLGAAGAH